MSAMREQGNRATCVQGTAGMNLGLEQVRLEFEQRIKGVKPVRLVVLRNINALAGTKRTCDPISESDIHRETRKVGARRTDLDVCVDVLRVEREEDLQDQLEQPEQL